MRAEAAGGQGSTFFESLAQKYDLFESLVRGNLFFSQILGTKNAALTGLASNINSVVW